jgi:hypothetical protein
VRRIIAEGADEIGETVRNMVAAFIETAAPAGSDGQIDRAAQRLGLIAAAGELATALEIVPWRAGEARDAAALALSQWIDGRGGTEPAEVRQAIEQVSREWMIPPEVWKTEICNGLDASVMIAVSFAILARRIGTKCAADVPATWKLRTVPGRMHV